MPRRSNAFQRVTALLHAQLSVGATVTESEMIPDARTGELREVDITVRSEVSGYPVLVGIECADYRRRATVQWVETMLGKHADLPTDKLVLVASGGFSKQALRKAEACGAICLSLKDAENVEWTAIVGKLPVAHLDIVNHKFQVSARLVGTDGQQITEEIALGAIITNAAGENAVHASNLALALINRQDVGVIIMQHMHNNSLTEHDYTLAFTAGGPMFVSRADGLRWQIAELFVVLRSIRSQTVVPLEHGAMKDSLVAFGEAKGDAGELRLAVIEKAGRAPLIELTQRVGKGWEEIVNMDAHPDSPHQDGI